MTINKQKQPFQLVNKTEVAVRFSEVDALGIVWHGHYLKFFEDGREAFGKQFELGYLDIHAHQFVVPLVSLNIDFKKTVKYGDTIIIETTYVDSPAAKIIFNYKLYRTSDMALVASGESIQIFMDINEELHITLPDFFVKWKKKYLLNQTVE
ncbi:MAG TPA: acyl-CoA thioesterase [Bacteroidia bacterium]|nr:acyl-CoA thioesterase [Bacteroidia bacterium]